MARNSTQQNPSSSVGISTALSQNQIYRHPIVYDKLTGVTNNQINDVLGKQQTQPSSSEYPIDHYQQQQPQSPQRSSFGASSTGGPDDFFVGAHRPFAPHMHGSHLPMMAPPPPRPPQQLGLFTTQPPRASFGATPAEPNADSQPSASSVTNNGAQRAPSNTSSYTGHQLAPLTNPQHQQLLQAQPVYYTPPIFAYNSAPDQNQNRLSGEPYGFLQQQHPQPGSLPSMGLPEPPMSVEEYQARQVRLRQLQQAQLQPQIEPTAGQSQSERYGRPVVSQRQGQVASADVGNPLDPSQQANLLASPQQQQRHRQQMLDLFEPNEPANIPIAPNQTSYYPDPAQLYRPPVAALASNRAPPYAHNLVNAQPGQLEPGYGPKLVAPNRSPPVQAPSSASQPSGPSRIVSSAPERAASKTLVSGQQAVQLALPTCARQLGDTGAPLNASNPSQTPPVLLCTEDPDYPTKEIMRALEVYASDRTVEQLLPQLLLQIHMAAQRANEGVSAASNRNLMGDIQRQLTLDSLQPSINLLKSTGDGAPQQQLDQSSAGSGVGQTVAGLFPSANYESMCRSSAYMAQPRRAKNLLGQWKVVVNLPGHKYRGIAISQMLRIEECSRPNSECSAPPQSQQQQQQQRALIVAASQNTTPLPILPRSRCLQHYENQRLVAWSHQQGLHLDIFRLPIACSCHIRR